MDRVKRNFEAPGGSNAGRPSNLHRVETCAVIRVVKNTENKVDEKLCNARREAITERIEGLKKAIYISAGAMTTIITVVQLILTYAPK